MIPASERFKRIELMLGRDACERIRNARVVVIGLGAVGGYAVEGLARAGVGNLKLVDFDRIAPSNFNRQLYALHSTVGMPKCEVAKQRVLDINPECNIETFQTFVDIETVSEVIGGFPDVVIDAIDALNPKVALLASLRTGGTPVVSCLGAAMRSDPTRIRVAPLSRVHHCPLGREVRSRLRRRKVPVDFPCVFSEEPLPHPLPIIPPEENDDQDAVLQRGRQRNTMGSLPTITGMFGLAAANEAIRLIISAE